MYSAAVGYSTSAPVRWRYTPSTAGALERATGLGTRVIWLVAATPPLGAPVGLAENWLYHHGPQLGTSQTIGSLRVYRLGTAGTERDNDAYHGT